MTLQVLYRPFSAFPLWATQTFALGTATLKKKKQTELKLLDRFVGKIWILQLIPSEYLLDLLMYMHVFIYRRLAHPCLADFIAFVPETWQGFLKTGSHVKPYYFICK